MNAPRLVAMATALALLSACGDDNSSQSATVPATAPDTSAALPTTTPSTLGPVTADLSDPAMWIGHTFTSSSMGTPMMGVSLDGVSTNWVTWPGCGMMESTTPPACIAFVREDLGQTEPGPATWIVLSWQVSDPNNFPMGGPVFDALSVHIDDSSLLPWAQCRSKAGDPGVFEAFIHYDITYQPAPGATAVTPEDLAAHPVALAWTLDAQHQLVSVPAEAVECVLYSYGD